MKKYILGALIGVCLIGVSAHAAVVLTSSAVLSGSIGTRCVSINKNLYYGLSGPTVSSLQLFLSNNNYLSSTLVTGYFGNNTLAAVKRYQSDHGINATGYVGPLTRASVQGQGCNVSNSVSNNTLTLPSAIIGPVKNPTLDYFTTDTDTFVGSKVTLHGSGFSPSRNTVIFGTIAINNVISTSSTELTFTIPQKPSVSCPVFSSQGCSVIGQTVSQSDSYQIYVINGNGGTSNTISLSLANTFDSAPYVDSFIGPSTIQTGTQGIWTLLVSSVQDTSLIANIDWGDTAVDTSGAPTSKTVSVKANQQQSLIFTHKYQQAGFFTITVTVIDDSSGLRTVQTTGVEVSDSFVPDTSTLFINSLLPFDARVGTQVTIQGSGFSPNGNIVHFGLGGIRNISSYNNGTLIYFAVPSSVNPCDAVNQGSCQALPVQIVPGSYQVSVTNAAGQTTDSFFFSVTQ